MATPPRARPVRHALCDQNASGRLRYRRATLPVGARPEAVSSPLGGAAARGTVGGCQARRRAAHSGNGRSTAVVGAEHSPAAT